MTFILTIVLSILAILFLVQALFFSTEVLLGVLSFRRARAVTSVEDAQPEADRTQRIAVLVPAHDEQSLIQRAVQSLVTQCQSGDRVVVIADNCSDETASLALAAGVEVCERHDDERRGKGYALDFGLDYLAADPPDIVVMMDADCVAEDGAMVALARAVATSERPVQGLYRMDPPAGASRGSDGLSLFAWRVRVELRCRGARALGSPSTLMGSGMAFPWDVIRGIDLAHGDLVEDLRSAVDLVESGVYPMFEPQAVVYSEQPAQESARASQRERWIQGHLNTLFARGPKLLLAAIKHRDSKRLAMCLEIMVLPIGLLGLCLGLGVVVSLILALLSGHWLVFALFFTGFVVTVVTVMLAWWFAGRDLVSGQALVQFVWQTITRIPLYAGALLKRQAKWVRTERD